MATETELSNQSVPINKIPKHSVDWVMRVLVIRNGFVILYKNSRHKGTFQTVILVDDEGTKLQATLFNKHIGTLKDFFKANKTYYIAKGLLDRVNSNYTSVHKEIELSITDNTIIKESAHTVSTHNFINGFVSLEQAEKNAKWCHIRMEHTTVTLWGGFAENDGPFHEKLRDDQPILGLCDVRISIYKGTYGLSIIPVSSVLINPMFQKTLDLRAWHGTHLIIC
ncbi:hypothetical protein H5410_035794 [Solanum commersonii]|uniref:Replication protein A 70 kDa DNA-binding subunit B/D first OB fold domain-containing protein n=1 Tax=Solanum commersonii TaxID=4109 RepID=A0A9J5Y3M2_SOLCO|nr:hypothetical protein H5410_035794 [Solanum commersonii]